MAQISSGTGRPLKRVIKIAAITSMVPAASGVPATAVRICAAVSGSLSSLAEVMADQRDYSADQFLELLRNKARLLVQPGSEAEAVDLAEAFRRQFQVG